MILRVVLRVVLGAVLAAMALGQLASFDAMPALLTAYGLTSGAASTALAVALIGAETVTAVWFLARPRSRAATPVGLYTGVAVVWAVLAAQAFARGLVLDNCGCFGTYATQPLRWYVLVEDALMLLYAWLLWRGLRRARPASSAARPFAAARTRQENHR
ncbi:MauE/DoxX family redox-associated membrane protein [Streptomyces sp. AC602_WCS936]|uniref:MauE/DoxX family redox-associated membrane protein n=1 Tax=Streptomyces sp. AC602_WCS936 TaxID=2823685 RepID=UPI001C276F60|nr:MauE/DoxX family redox-associated membrane protein [Streptomyces sp. AC602_WCS936]